MANNTGKQFVTSNIRDYALITLMKTFRRLELLDEKRNNDNEITKLRHFIGQFVHKTMNDENASPEDIAIIEKYPEVMEIADEKDETKANELTKSLLKKYQKALLDSTADYKRLTIADCEDVKVDIAAVYDQVFKPYIDEHNNSRRNKNNQIDKKEFVRDLINGSVNDDVAHLVLKAKEKVLAELKRRQFNPDKQSDRRFFQEEINSVLPGLTIEYLTQKNTEAVKQANLKVRSYFSAADAKTYRDKYPDDKTARRIAPGSKEDFLKLLGSLALAGYKQVHKGIKASERSLGESFQIFRGILVKNYPNENPDNLVAKVLGIPANLSPEESRKRCLDAFAEKGASVYTQMLGGFIQLRTEKFPEQKINSSIIKALEKYIIGSDAEGGDFNGTDGLLSGKQNIKMMALFTQDQDTATLSDRQERKRGQEIKQEESKKQHTNVDHIIPVASAIKMYMMIHPEEKLTMDPNTLRLSELLTLAEKAAPLVDNIANHRQVISSSVNSSLDANGSYVLEENKDASILATSYSISRIKEIIGQMEGLDSAQKERYLEAFAKYTRSNSRGIITTNLDLPEHPDVAGLRKEYAPQKNLLDLRVVLEKVSARQQ